MDGRGDDSGALQRRLARLERVLGPEPSVDPAQRSKPGGLRLLALIGFTVSLGLAMGGLSRGDTSAVTGGGALAIASLGSLYGIEWVRAKWFARIAGKAQPARMGVGVEASEDPRLARIDAACDRIEAELRQARPHVRDLLGASERTVVLLRSTCGALVVRERALRAECSPERLALLEHEWEEVVRRLKDATDERIRRSLSSAVAAIDDQKRQRALLATSADRLDAELTRLEWTLDGMAAQLVRLRTAEDDVAAPPEEVLRTLGQLHDEIDAMADALEHLAGSSPRPVAEIVGRGEEAAPTDSAHVRSR